MSELIEMLRQTNKKPMRTCRIVLPLFFISVLFANGMIFPPHADANEGRVIKQISLDKDSCRIGIKLNGNSPYKVVQIDKKEVIIAFQGVRFSKNMKIIGAAKPLVSEIKTKSLPDNVSALFVNTVKELKEIKTKWIKTDHTLMVRLDTKENLSGKKKNPGKEAKQKIIVKREKKSSSEISKDLTQLENSKKSGNIDDIICEIKDKENIKNLDLQSALDKCSKKSWEEAFLILRKYIENRSSGFSDPLDRSSRPLETACFLKAYTYFKTDIKDKKDQLRAAKFFQDAISYFPESKYLPYGMAALGMINKKLRNYNEAKGYFRIVLKKHKDYSGTPEVLFEIGKIYLKERKLRKAISIFKRLVSKYPDAAIILDAKIELGKALYEKNNFYESIKVLTDAMGSNPQTIYRSDELLLSLGNGYYEIGEYKKAIEFFFMVCNYFPETESNHINLTRIGDIYNSEKEFEKAKKIYQLVIDKFPGTDGFIISSIRLAEFLKEEKEKEKIYLNIINNYPDNPLMKSAMLKLATAQKEAGEYEKSIITINDLINKHPGKLQKEAARIREESYKFYLKKLLDEDDYPEILLRFENEKKIFKQIKSPEIYQIIGEACLKGHLYEKAADILTKSCKLFGSKKRPSDLVFSLGVSLHESGEFDQALKIFSEYERLYPERKNSSQAHFRMGRILLSKKEYQKAVERFSTAYNCSKTSESKALILIDKAKGYAGLDKFEDVSANLIEAVNLLESASEKNFKYIFRAYRNLGENYFLKLNLYEKAADALANAMKFADKGENHSDILFMLARSYQNQKETGKARKIYSDMAVSGDRFWKKMAKEQLNRIKFEEKLKQ